MAQFNKVTTMTITQDDRAWLEFGKYVLKEIATAMDADDSETLENVYTGEVVEREDIKRAIWTINSLVDAQESWGWKLV